MYFVIALVAITLLSCGGAGKSPAPAKPLPPPERVTLVEYSDQGERIGVVTAQTVVKSDDEWQRILTPVAFSVTRRKGTELAFTGAYHKLKDRGLYRCIACGNALFGSDAKFDSRTGWPSFWMPIAAGNIMTRADHSLLPLREEVICRKCDSHLGHVFPDGPPPTGLRYCINSAALRFVRFPNPEP